MNTHLNDEISTGSRPTYITNGEWNQQTIYDARNVLQTQHSVEASQQANEQRSGKSKLSIFLSLFINYLFLLFS